MFSIEPHPLPDGALLQTYRQNGSYTDCYAIDVPASISFEEYVAAFYTTFVFKTERFILKWVVSKPSTDAQARQLAAGSDDDFAAWRVEKRAEDQLLLSDYRGRTRSWLMVAPQATGTRLYFGSAVVPARASASGESRLGFFFSAVLGFHKIYSQVLLRAAVQNLANR